MLDSKTAGKLKTCSEINPAAKKLFSNVEKLDSYHILEYKPDFSKKMKLFDTPIKHPTVHTGWHADLIQVSPYRLYRPLSEDKCDYATIISITDSELVIDWDLWGKEHFKKEQDGKYHFYVPK